MCHLQYTNDLLVLTGGGIKDLRVIKLILYLFKVMLGMAVNFNKTMIYFTMIGQLPEASLLKLSSVL